MPADGGAPTPYIPNTGEDRAAILAAVGHSRAEELFADLPAEHRDPPIALAPALTEMELRAHFAALAARNAASFERPAFLGAGAYRRFVPTIAGALASRFEFATAYTPYQPEISQGTLQAAFEFQSVVCELTGMDTANTGLYDVASATAEACLLAARATRRRAVALLEPLHPGIADVTGTYAFGADLRVDRVGDPAELTADHACLVVQQPDFLGVIVDLEPLAAAAHAVGALCVVVADPFALGMLRAPGDAGADVVVGEGRDLAGPVGFGGPSLGLFATRREFVRQMPGRVVGRTRELQAGDGREPREGFVLTLQAREQFIRRERATSNFSTGQSLVALAFTIAVQSLGPVGLRRAAELCYHRAHAAAARVAAVPGYRIVDRGPWFQEFLLQGPVGPLALAEQLRARGIVPGLPVASTPGPGPADALLCCVTETTADEQVDRLVAALAEIGGPS